LLVTSTVDHSPAVRIHPSSSGMITIGCSPCPAIINVGCPAVLQLQLLVGPPALSGTCRRWLYPPVPHWYLLVVPPVPPAMITS
jgi:hypothetical protein